MTKQYKYVCDCGKYKSNSFIGYKTHYAMKHPDKVFPLQEDKPQKTTTIKNDDYPDFLFSTDKEKEIFLYLKNLNDTNPDLCSKTTSYLYEQYPDIVKKFGDPSSPLFLQHAYQTLSQQVQYVDKLQQLQTQSRKYEDSITKMREDFNSLQSEIQDLQDKKQTLQEVEEQLQEEEKQLKLLRENVNYKKISKVIVDIDELIENDFIYNNIDRYYILREDKYKDLQYLIEKLVLVYNKK